MDDFYTLLYKSNRSRAKRGIIRTSHGVIQTPAFVPVGTKATVKAITAKELKELQTQVIFVNTYHLATHPGTEVIYKAGGVHKFAHIRLPIMSDSGGFQVFSLAQKRQGKMRGEGEDALVVKIHKEGVRFRSVYDGTTLDFNPQTSMVYQAQIGADLLMAFDECTPQNSSKQYARESMERTHEWLIQSIRAKKDLEKNKKTLYPQFLYGIIQGAGFQDLREESAQFVVNQNTPGIAIGGVAVGEGKEEIRKQVSWVAPYLPEYKPVHLLGVGFIEDIIDLVKHGIDTFDCVEPTRMAREGRLLVWEAMVSMLSAKESEYVMDINSNIYKHDLESITAYKDSPLFGISRAYLHHLFKQKELLAYNLATQHNVFVMNKFMELIRKKIEQDEL